MTPTVWDTLWESATVDDAAARVEAEERSLRFRRIVNSLTRRLGGLDGTGVVELGAGIGTTAIALAKRGAVVTLVDESDAALAAADAAVAAAGCEAQLVKGDLFAPDDEQAARFDVAMSFGVAEHFAGARRADVLRAHLHWLRPGGIAVVGVPNSLCPTYRAWKWWLERKGEWAFGYEEPFHPRELRRLAREVGGVDVEIVGSSAVGDALQFATPMVAHRLSGGRLRLPTLHVPSPLDPVLGYALNVIYAAPPGDSS